MARTLSWIDRIVPIARTVAASACSHYSRKDLQRLFEIQPRSAQNLMAAMPVISVGRSHLIEREALASLLQKLNQAENPTQAFARLRSKAAKPPYRKLRTLSLNDVSADLNALPDNLTLRPGEMTVRFQTVDQLAEAMVYLATLLQDRLEEFVARYEPLPIPLVEEDQQRGSVALDATYIERWLKDQQKTVESMAAPHRR